RTHKGFQKGHSGTPVWVGKELNHGNPSYTHVKWIPRRPQPIWLVQISKGQQLQRWRLPSRGSRSERGLNG
ncbi:4908_t:CDS:2, partial [Acaulospora colombiana]